MSGTITGGKQAAKTNKERHGEDFYKILGKKGGSKTNTKPKGFAYSKANGLTTHIEAGRKGGVISRKPSNDS